MSVIIDIYPVNSYIKGGGNYMPWREIDRVCSYFPTNAIYSNAYLANRWDGVIHLYKSGRFPTGLISLVRGVLDKHNIPYKLRLGFKWPERMYNWMLNPLITVRDRHEEAIDSVLKHKRGILQLPTRFGKTTVVASGTIAGFGVNTLFIAHQLDLIYDAKSIFEKFIMGVDEIGVIGDGHIIYKPLTVACIDSLANKLNDYTMQVYLRDKVKYVIVDETQYYGPGEYKKVLNMCNAPYRIFMSATPERNDGADLELMAGSGKIIYSLTEQEMIAEGYISDVNIEMVPFDHKLYNEKATGIVYSKFYDEFITHNRYRNKVIVEEVKNLLVEGHPTLIIVRRIDHGHNLKEMLAEQGINKVEFIWGEIDAKERINLRNKFNAGDFDVLIGSTVFDTAIDLHRASGLVLAASGNSKIRAPQRVGRVLSQVMGKVAYVKDIKDLNIKYFAEDAKDRQRIYINRYGDSRVKVRGLRDLSEEEKKFGINFTKMFDNIL